jgi:hypothetical protein
MTITDLSAQAQAWALDEAAKASLGEDFGVGVCWTPQPAQSPQGVVPVPGWVLLITARNPLLGQNALYHLVPVGTPVPVEADVRAEVVRGIKMLRDLAASKLTEVNGGPRP